MTLEMVVPTVTPYVNIISATYLVHVYDETQGEAAGFLSKMQRAYKEVTADIIGYVHNDLTIHEGWWEQRVLAEFEWPTVAVVGFLGGTHLGTDDIYKVPYDFRQLARGGVVSNFTDAEVHGRRETGSMPVSVLDSCAIFVRRSFLQRLGGWPLGKMPNTSHCTDLWLCGQAARLGRQVRMVGVSCTHASGGKGEAGSKWLEAHGGDERLHRDAHRATYDLLRGVLPLRTQGD